MSIRRRFQAALILALVAWATVASLNVWTVNARTRALATSRHISQAQLVTQQLFGQLVDQDVAIQAFLATSNQEYVRTAATAHVRERELIARLGPLLGERTQEWNALRSLGAALQTWHDEVARETAGDWSRPDPALIMANQQAFQNISRNILALQADTTQAITAARDDLDAAVFRVTVTLYASLVATGLMSFLLLLLVRGWVLRPLSRITEAIRAVSDGALDTVIPAAGPAELAALGDDVDAMRRRVLREADTARTANVELARAEAEQRLLFDSVRDYAIVRLDPDGIITRWNTGAELITGHPAATMIGKPAAWLQSTSSEDPAENILAEVAAQGTLQLQAERRRADGTRFIAAMVITVIHDSRGEVQGYAVVSQDVTAALAAKDAVSRANVVLTERADELQRMNALLARANQDLVAANEELDAFSYTVSHDLRAPLRSINGFSQVLLEDHRADLSTEGARLLGRVADNAERMGELINDLLAFSRLRRSGLTKTRTSVMDVVTAAWQEVEPTDSASQVCLNLGRLPELLADAGLLKQVFVNLLSNAVKFSQAAVRERAPGPLEISIDVGTDPAGSGQPVISVRDQGIGFDPRYADKLFAVFQRLHGEQVEGTGIGLSIVHRIVTRHGGRIWADSEPGHGATFSFTLGPDSGLDPAKKAAGKRDPAVPDPAVRDPAVRDPAVPAALVSAALPRQRAASSIEQQVRI